MDEVLRRHRHLLGLQVRNDRRARSSSAARLKPDRTRERCSRGLRRAPLPGAYAYRYRHRLHEVCVSDRQSFRFLSRRKFRCFDRRAISLSRHPVAVQRTHGDASIGSFSHHRRRSEANAPAEAPEFPSQRRASSPTPAPSRRHTCLFGARARARCRTRRLVP